MVRAQAFSVARAALKDTKRTIVDVSRTLPLLLPALFFLIFIA